MKRLLVLFLCLTFAIGTVNAQDTIEKNFKVSKGGNLEIDIECGGDVTIEGWDKNEVAVKAVNRYRDWADYDVEIEQTSRGVSINVDKDRYYRDNRRSRRNRITFEIKVPKEFDIRMNSMGGSFTISNIEGKMRGKTMGGDIDLRNLKGRVDITTMGGEITVKDSEVDGRVKTMGGEVLIEDVVGNLRASSMGGNVEHRNFKDRRGNSTGGEVRIKTMGGSIRKSDAPDGADLHTMGGDIRLRSAKKHVKAVTMGGDIQIDELDGWIEAVTYSGDIEVTVIGESKNGKKDIELRSLSGDIELTIPKNFSMDMNAVIEYTRNSRGRYKIESDFKLKIDESKEWEEPRGDRDRRSRWSRRDLRKYIDGTVNINGGKNKVILRTINGNIYINKGK